jgi:hypothetical protein
MSARRGFAADERRSTLIGKGESVRHRAQIGVFENVRLRNLLRVLRLILRFSAFICG